MLWMTASSVLYRCSPSLYQKLNEISTTCVERKIQHLVSNRAFFLYRAAVANSVVRHHRFPSVLLYHTMRKRGPVPPALLISSAACHLIRDLKPTELI